MTVALDRKWWHDAVVYQLYPRSFQDSDGDGIGDLEGIIRRLDYLNDGTPGSLGVDAVWLSPTFPSPMKDFGYDVLDYRGVHPDFGDLATMDRLIAECHKRSIRVLLDWVPNHTSDQHPWFLESRSSKVAPKRNWYVWRDEKADGSFPNNWVSAFGGPAWTFDPATGQYYLHSFLEEQPDLNWRNPEVVAAMHDVLRFWLDRGVDGFRIDVMGMIVKHPGLADNPPAPGWKPGGSDYARFLWRNNRNHPDVYPAVRGIRRVLDEYADRVAVGEVFGTAEEVAAYYGGDSLDGLHLAFNFQFIFESEADRRFTPWDAEAIRRIVANAERALPPGAQPCWAFGNHDRSRFLSRHNHDGHGYARARAAALLLLGLRGTPFVFYGEEIGMPDVAIPENRLQDPARFRSTGRDPERTPMQWDSSEGRGFSTAEPWLPYGPLDINVAAQADDETSILSLYRRAIWLRKQTAALLRGSLELLPAAPGIAAFARRAPGAKAAVVVVNTSLEAQEFAAPGTGSVLLATDEALAGARFATTVTLPPLAAAWLQLD
ncbi:MAG: alpha-amylase [Chloroflexi bacterium]|nr:alpha-amylase [Chloroflexota bacterium]